MQTTTKTKLRFAHLADCHVGSWREPKMRELNILAFSSSIDKIIRINSEETSDKKIDFVLISGDLFNTAIPSIDALKEVTEKLKLLHDAGITVYGIGGSHDYSAAGKSMLDVL
jgi:DNA repair exonuclease SbcCD nuclease subunit